MRMLYGCYTESDGVSKIRAYIPDPSEGEMARVLAKYPGVTKDNLPDKAVGNDLLQADLMGIGAILPYSVHMESGKRCDVPINIGSVPVPPTSLIYVISMNCIVPDGCHLAIRVVEKDLKLVVEFLLSRKRYADFKRLENNINDRNVKYPHFRFEVTKRVDGFPVEIGHISMSGTDAHVLLASKSDMSATGIAEDLFEGVFYNDRVIPNKLEKAIEVLRELHAETEPELIQFTRNENDEFLPSERSIADLLFYSNRKIQEFLRDPDMTKENSSILRKWVETNFQCNILLFQPGKASVPYKSKMLVMLHILENGVIRSLSDHLTEGMENSNHGAHSHFQNKTMRDGGNWRDQICSEFHDISNSFTNSLVLCTKRDWRRLPQELCPLDPSDLEVSSENFQQKYLQICRSETFSCPKLEVGKTTLGEILRGMRFNLIGNFSAFKTTQPKLRQMITELGGCNIATTQATTFSKEFETLFHCYVLLPDPTIITDYMNQTITETRNNIIITTQGDWIYLKVQFLLDCVKDKELKDPAFYVITVDRSNFVRSRATMITRLLYRQRLSTETPSGNLVLGQTALRIAKIKKRKPVARTTRNRVLQRVRVHRNVSVAQTAYKLFCSDYSYRKNQQFFSGSSNTTRSIAWKDHNTRMSFIEKARDILATPTTTTSTPTTMQYVQTIQSSSINPSSSINDDIPM